MEGKDMNRLPIRRYTAKELCRHYNCSRSSLHRWLKTLKVGRPVGHFYNTDQVRQIFEHLGYP